MRPRFVRMAWGGLSRALHLGRASGAVAVVATCLLLAGCISVTGQSRAERPTAVQTAAFRDRAASAMQSLFGSRATVVGVQIVYGRSDAASSRSVDAWRYQYAVFTRIRDVDTLAASVYSPDATLDDFEYEGVVPSLSDRAIKALAEYSKVESEPVLSLTEEIIGPGSELPAGATVWNIFSFDPTNSGNYFYGTEVRFLDEKNGRLRRLPDE